MKSGRYVIFYNERLDGVTYPEDYVSGTVFTELCDVIVHGKQTCVCLFVCFLVFFFVTGVLIKDKAVFQIVENS